MLKILLACLCLAISVLTRAEDILWEFEATRWQEGEISGADQSSDESAVTRGNYYLARQWYSGEDKLMISYAHQPLLIRLGDPAHNGYLHQLDLETSYNFSKTRIVVGAGIHGSSNMFKYGDFHSEAGVFKFAVLHRFETWDGEAGINGDHQFGNFRIYPRIRFSRQTRHGGEIAFDLPKSVVWQRGPWQLAIKGYGEKWAALDKEREIQSALYLQEWRVSSRLQLWRRPNLSAYAEFGMSFNTRLEYLDLSSGWQDRRLDESVFIALGLQTF